jgi:UDP-N-acetylmuramate dehydrogenase
MIPGLTFTEQASLQARNGFRVPARAELLVEVHTPHALPELFACPWLQAAPLLILGDGSNTLLVGDVAGAVLSVKQHGRSVLADDGDGAVLRIAAGEPWDDVVRWSLGLGLRGLENLALIPGTVGAAPIQNIGAYGVELAEFVETVEAWDRLTATMVRLNRSECAFGYRDSVFKQHPGRWLVMAVELRLQRHRPLQIEYPGLPQELAALGADENPRAAQVAEAVTRLRTRKLPDPRATANVGSFFRNPIVASDLAETLARSEPNLPRFATEDPTRSKLSAAWLIERAGWKGHRDGDAGVSSQHALVLVNHGQASGAQILDLAQRIAASVEERFGVALEPEARIVGASWQTRTSM